LTLREPGVIGSLVVDGKTTRMLDLFELTRLAHPAWFAGHAAGGARDTATKRGDRAATILLAEDSKFFLKQVASYMKDAGYEVIECEDGLDAWNKLQTTTKTLDLVVTDLEMPNMGGLELARKIKDDPRFNHLPIIALTSLAGEEDMQRGMEAGIDDYQIKLDRERLLASVANYLHSTTQATHTREQLATAGTER